MPSVRLLTLAPAPGQQLQLLRSAGSASSSSTARHTTASRQDSRVKDRNAHAHAHAPSTMAALSSQPSWCRGASPAVGLFHSRATTTTAAVTTASPAPHRARIHCQQPQPLPATARSFGSATMPKQVAFPRHGKAVAPHLPEEKKESSAEDKDTQPDTQPIQAQVPGGEQSPKPETPASKPTPGKQPGKKNGKWAKAGSEAKAKEGAATAVTSIEASQPSSPSATSTEAKDASSSSLSSSGDAQPRPEPPTAKIDAQGALGHTGVSSTNVDPAEPSSIAADAAAASVTAAEMASVAADVVNGADPFIELGTPKVTIGALLAPNAGQQGTPQPKQPNQQQQQQQQEAGDETSPSSSPPARQPLSHNKLPPPHLAPPLYVHHFDSYSLVKQLEEGGYRKEQAVTAMKAVRSLLAQNLDVAQSSLVSKSDVENEAYLFKAACAELSIEVRNNRRRADELVRQQRSLLQHEVDIAAQSVNQELLTLADVVKELFNDRKMAVREEQKALESAIQQLSYKITIMLNSEMRSEIEGLRWVLIRRSVLGIIFMAILTLGTLRYASYISHEKQRNAERALREAREAEAQRFADTKIDTSAPPDAAEILAAN
ncbi:hypothetical protein SCUCBS95973_001281 [Sporothrix curviconia]|uniref:MOZ protein represents a chromatin-associated acetyltransferase n=1 Tax=Sporothrix curviconia TaxID=1260050 RepID=A0ABP0AXA9_9PEZI